MPQRSDLGPFTEVMRHPGFDWVVAETGAYRNPPAAFFYAAYLRDHPGLDEGQVLKVSGFTYSRWAAHAEILDLEANGAWWLKRKPRQRPSG